MDKRALKADLARAAGGSLLINKSQLRAALGSGNNPGSLVNKVTENLEYVWTGKAKVYYVGDVVRELSKHTGRDGNGEIV